MITFYLDKKQYTFPNAWDELAPDQFRALVAVLMDYAENKLTADTARALWFCAIAKIPAKLVTHPKKGELVAENIYRASREFTFFFKVEYDGDISNLSPETRKLMRKQPPNELQPTPEIRWALKLKYDYVVNAAFAAQLLPQIKVKKRVYNGYSLSFTSGILTTSINAQQYIDANNLFNRFVETKNDVLLNELIAVLYSQGKYNPDNIPAMAKQFENVNAITKLAVLFNFQAFQSFLATRTHFALLWSRTSTGTGVGKISIGMADSLYTLAKGGFGSVEELCRINMISFLELLLKNLSDTARYLHENKVSMADISEKTGLSITNIQKLI